jgi:threonine/homoserine/homoserine lactone efflux protein
MVGSIHWAATGPLILAALAIMGSPGPATIGIAAASAAFGLRRSFPYAAGILAGTEVVLAAVAAGLTATLLAVPALRPVLIGLSALYILRLAYRVATAPPLGSGSAEAAPSLAGGVVLGIANPKAWVAIAATFSSARLADDATTDALAKTAILAALLVLMMSAWAAVGASLAPVLRDARRARVVNVTLAVALVVATALAVVH